MVDRLADFSGVALEEFPQAKVVYLKEKHLRTQGTAWAESAGYGVIPSEIFEEIISDNYLENGVQLCAKI